MYEETKVTPNTRSLTDFMNDPLIANKSKRIIQSICPSCFGASEVELKEFIASGRLSDDKHRAINYVVCPHCGEVFLQTLIDPLEPQIRMIRDD